MKVFIVLPEDLGKKDWNYVNDEEVKCGGCNWRVSRLFVLAKSKREAVKLVKEGNAGLCAECFMDMIVEEGFEMVKPNRK